MATGGPEEERHVGADRPRRSRAAPRRRAGRGSSPLAAVSAAPASLEPPPRPAPDRDALVDAHAEAAAVPRRLAERAPARASRGCRRRPGRGSARGSARRRRDRQHVGEVDAGHQRQHLVVAVRRASGPTRRTRLIFAGAWTMTASASRSVPGQTARERREGLGRERLGAHRRGQLRARRRARSTRSRGASPASDTLLTSVLRRCAKAACTSCRQMRPGRRAAPPTRARRRKATSAESTFGGGTKTVRGTGWKPVRSVGQPHRARRRRRTPACRAVAKRRSPTSRCTITHHVPIDGARPSDSTTSGVATL